MTGEKHSKYLSKFARLCGGFWGVEEERVNRFCDFLEQGFPDVYQHGYKHGVQDAEDLEDTNSIVDALSSLGLKTQKTYAVGTDFKHKEGKGWQSEGIFTEQKECAKAWKEYDRKHKESGP